MELMPTEEIFEVNSNSTTDTIKEQRLARNKELRLKATYLVSRRPAKTTNQQKEYNSESSSEFPASSPSNPQMQRKSQYHTRPPLLKNTLPADAFERGLALIATKEQMSMSEKIESWQCVATDEFSDVEDVVNFDKAFEQREENKIKQLSKTKYELKNKSQKSSTAAAHASIAGENCIYSFTEFQRRLLAIDPRKTNLPGIEPKHNSKLTSEEDEKPTTSNNFLTRNRDAPLKKRSCKYKRAAEPIAHLPIKKSSSSETPRDGGGAPSPKKKVVQQQQQKIVAAKSTTGEHANLLNEKFVCPSSSETSSHLVQNDNIHAVTSKKLRSSSRSQAQIKSKPKAKIIEASAINANWNRAVRATNTVKNDEQESFFRWRRLSREIDKVDNNSKNIIRNAYRNRPPIQIQKNSPLKERKGLIQIRYDFLEELPKKTNEVDTFNSNAYNVVVKPLKIEKANNNNNTNPTIKSVPLNCEETFVKTEKPKESEPDSIKKNDAIVQDSCMEFHQQHEFCNYLGLTGKITANAMATAAAELSKCNLARRSLRVRHLEQRKAKSKNKQQNQKIKHEKIAKEKQESISDSTKCSITKQGKTVEGNANANRKMPSKKQTSATSSSLKSLTKENIANEKASSVQNETNSQKTKDNDVKIKILCQITTSNSQNDDEQNKKNINEEQNNSKIRTMQEQKQFEPGNTPIIYKTSQQISIIKTDCDKDDTKFIKHLKMTPIKRQSDGSPVQANEVQKLHEKVQKRLEEARQNAPNIFIVQSLDSTAEKKTQQNDSEPKRKCSDANCIADDASNKETKQVNINKSPSVKEKLRKKRNNMKKTNNNGNRRLYTRSMLNLNQQRELRNRKVILKILKTYSGLKIKVSNTKPKEKEMIKSTEEKQSKQSSETDNDQIKNSITDLTLDCKKCVGDENNTNDMVKQPDINEITKTVFNTDMEQLTTANSEIKKHETMIEVAVQTDALSPTQQIFKNLDVLSPSKIQESIKFHGEMDVSSSGDVVTSTTNVAGDQSRCDAKTPPNLVSNESIIDTKAIVNHVDAVNKPKSPHKNVSISTSTNDLGIHALCEPNAILQNPLQDTDGLVLHVFFELDVLIVVQESLISFWKYIRLLNLLSDAIENTIDEKQCKGGSNSKEMPPAEPNDRKWIFLGEQRRLQTDTEIASPYMNRLCLSESRPVYVEMRCRELANEFRECSLLSCYVNVYFFKEEDQVAICHSIQLDSIQSIPSDIIYTAINDSRYFVLAWPQANLLGKVRSGLCKYALTPELDMLATTRDFKAMRHVLRSLECLNDGKLLGFGDTQLTVWDHRSGDILMNYDLNLPLGRNLGNIYYPSFENGQNNVVVIIQHIRNNETSSELLMIACTISHANPMGRVIRRYKLPMPTFANIRNSVNNGEHFVIQSETGEEIAINCNDPHQMMFMPAAQHSTRFYTRGRTQIIELTKQKLTVDSFSSYLLRIAADNNKAHKNKINENWYV